MGECGTSSETSRVWPGYRDATHIPADEMKLGIAYEKNLTLSQFLVQSYQQPWGFLKITPYVFIFFYWL